MSTQDQCRASRLLPRPELRFGTAALSYDSEADHRNVPEPVICVKRIRAIRRTLASTLFVAITSIRLSYVNDPDAQPVCGGDGYIDGHTNKISQANKRFAPLGNTIRYPRSRGGFDGACAAECGQSYSSWQWSRDNRWSRQGDDACAGTGSTRSVETHVHHRSGPSDPVGIRRGGRRHPAVLRQPTIRRDHPALHSPPGRGAAGHHPRRLHGRQEASTAFYQRLKELFAQKKSITTFGPYSPGQAVTMKRMGIGASTSAAGPPRPRVR